MTATPSPASRFALTQWTIVLAAGNWRAGSAAHRDMGELAQLYWSPLYAYLRRMGRSPADAEDLVQGFFTHLLEKDAFASVDPSKGKFRSFLLASLKHFLSDQWDKARSKKRGGDLKILDLESPSQKTT